LKNICSSLGDAEKGGRLELRAIHVKQIPIVVGNEPVQKILSLKSNHMLTLHAQLQQVQTDFQNLLSDNFAKLKWNKSIENWHAGDFAGFKKSLEKQKIEIPLKKQKEWREVFESEKATYHSLQTQIAATEKAIDTQVYALYELTAEEIQIIENQ
jgi:hypothetical protein